MDIITTLLGVAMIGSSLASQLIGLPEQALRNRRNRSVEGLSKLFIFLGVTSYGTATLWAVVNGEWFVGLSRVGGVVAMSIIIVQIIMYRNSLNLVSEFGHRMGPDCGTCRTLVSFCDDLSDWTRRCTDPSCKKGRQHLIQLYTQGLLGGEASYYEDVEAPGMERLPESPLMGYNLGGICVQAICDTCGIIRFHDSTPRSDPIEQPVKEPADTRYYWVSSDNAATWEEISFDGYLRFKREAGLPMESTGYVSSGPMIALSTERRPAPTEMTNKVLMGVYAAI